METGHGREGKKTPKPRLYGGKMALNTRGLKATDLFDLRKRSCTIRNLFWRDVC